MSYALLEEHHRLLAHLRHAEAILAWDEATLMPVGGGLGRADAVATLRGIIHREQTRAEMGDLFAKARAEVAGLSEWQRANLRKMESEWVRAIALKPDLVRASSRAESLSEQVWREARARNDFKTFLPYFREVVVLKRECAQSLGDRLGLSAYDALIDAHEPGMRSNRIAVLLARLRAFLPGLIAEAQERQSTEDFSLSKGPFPAERQQAIAVDLLRRLGFDFDHGRLDTSHHPFCIGTPGDVRVTTRFETSDCMDSALSVLHECGHAKYEQNLPWDWRTQPVGSAPAVSIHESQSLLHENHIGRSRAFLEFVAPLLREAFPEFSEDFRPECLFRRMTRVRPGALRSQADEATYPCHIVLRFELESALIGGALQPEDVPEAWNAGMRDLLGVSTEGNDCDGCMQDMHWPAGLFGYFPSYVLGALTAAQLLEAFQRQYPDFEVKVRQGDLSAVDEWLRQRVWSKGSLLQAGELIESATGRALETAPFEAYLTRRYVQRTL